MKRKDYFIYLNDQKVAVKHTWNAARKHVPEIIRDALASGESAREQAAHCTKDDTGFHAVGSFYWLTSSGRVLRVQINKQGD